MLRAQRCVGCASPLKQPRRAFALLVSRCSCDPHDISGAAKQAWTLPLREAFCRLSRGWMMVEALLPYRYSLTPLFEATSSAFCPAAPGVDIALLALACLRYAG